MPTAESSQTARLAEAIYEQRLKEQLEKTNRNQFVSIEPISGDYFLGQTLSEAVGASRRAHPDRLCHTVRIGHRAAVRLAKLTVG